jgi:3-phenylpropionate/trans-cinnamate dioxygenase ferredoxin subunit
MAELDGKIDTGFGSESPLDYAFRVTEEAHAPKARRGNRITVCAANEIPAGEKHIVEYEKISIGVFNIKGAFYAIKNVCPHYGAPLCQGHIQTTHRPGEVGEFHPALEGRVIRCPWHGWEFDIVTGKGLYDRNGRVATYLVEVDENGDIVIIL